MTEEKQLAHIDLLLNRSDKREQLIKRIQNIYEKYGQSIDNSAFTELIGLLEREDFCLGWIRTNLWRTGCYSEDNEHDVLQDARIVLWQSIIDGKAVDNFAYYAFGVYKIKALDLIRKVSKNRAKVSLVSIDEPIGDDGKQTICDTIPAQFYDSFEEDEKRKLYSEVFRYYCFAFMNSDAYPPRCLALFYARVLPHLLEEIPYTKAASAKWAFERMGTQSVANLTHDSEKIIQKDITRDLAWGPGYMHQLDEDVSIMGKSIVLRDVIFTAVYDKGKIEDWADYMHKVTRKDAVKLIQSDKDLLDMVKAYVSSDSILKKFFNIKEGNSR